jgi:HIT domain
VAPSSVDPCTFFEIVAGTIPADLVTEDDEVVVFLSLEDHPLVVPKAHVPTIYETSDALGAAVMRQAIRVAKAVKLGLACDGVYPRPRPTSPRRARTSSTSTSTSIRAGTATTPRDPRTIQARGRGTSSLTRVIERGLAHRVPAAHGASRPR